MKLWRFLIASEGSTRAAGLMRIGLVLLLWDRWGSDFLLYRLDDRYEWLIGGSFFVATPLLLLGIWSRFMALWTAITMLAIFYFLGIERGVEPYTHHHTFLLVCFSVLVACTPCGGSFSVDRYLALRAAERAGASPPEEMGPLWGQRLIALQVSALYFWTAYDKLNLPFLSGVRLQHIFIDRYGSSDAPTLPFFEEIAQASAIATVILEFTLAFGLWVPRFQLALLIVAMFFHGTLFVTLPVGPFSCTMIVMILAFFDPERVHAAVDRLTR